MPGRRDVTTILRTLTALAVVVSGGACGQGDLVSRTSPPPTPPPPPQILKVPQIPPPPPLVFANLRPGAVVFADITLDRLGTVSAAADWVNPSNNVALRLTEARCADPADTSIACDTWGRANGVSTKPQRLSVQVPPGTMRLWITNLGPEKETVSVTLFSPLPF
jgi:hypothetical protein